MLTVENLKVDFKTGGNFVSIIESVSFGLADGETLGIVGESGCGKTVTAHAIMGLLDSKHTRVQADKLNFVGKDILTLGEKDLRHIRGNEISMIFQNPMTSLNPLMRCGRQIIEPLLEHTGISRKDAGKKCIQLLGDMGLREPELVYKSYPHTLSGGMRQRVMIAMALICEPRILIADEPTTALDVTIQAQILDLIKDLQKRMGMGLVLITHDMGIVHDIVDELIIMYAGQIIEKGPTDQVIDNSKHPYTRGLIKALPGFTSAGGRLHNIEGTVPSPSEFPSGCRFHDRCERAEKSCRELIYGLNGSDNHKSACQFYNSF